MSFDSSCCVTCPCLKCSTDRVPYSPALLYSCMSIRLVGRVERVIWLATLGLWVKEMKPFFGRKDFRLLRDTMSLQVHYFLDGE